ncbi:MAG TPA: branched-chain amino acid ABC transporter permease [Ktedonobacteraceae bacterium]|nr:branched-chain amino acid ABC transporter permease [Ktedonobacteraceae bacterium]
MKILKIVVLLAALACAILFPLLFPNPAIDAMAVFTLLFTCAASGWNIFSGYTGYVSLGYGTYYGLGAYAMALICRSWNIPGGYTTFLLVPLAGLATSLLAIPLGWISLRVRGHTFVIVTIATLYVFQLLAYNLQFLTDGNSGMTLPIPPWSAWDFNVPFYYVALVLVLLTIGVSWWIRSSKYGFCLLAIRDDEERARGLGIKTGTYKLTAFVIAAFFAGMVGAVAAYFTGSIFPPSAFDPTFDVAPTLMVFLGGAGTLLGPVIGAVLLEPLQQYLIVQFGAVGLDLILYGSLMLLVILQVPRGIVPTIRRLWVNWRTSKNMAVRHSGEQEENAMA